MCYELTWFHKLCFGTAVQSHANPSVKGVLHIADVIQRAVFVCMFIHKGISHSSVFHLRLHSTNTRIQVHRRKAAFQRVIKYTQICTKKKYGEDKHTGQKGI